MIWQDIQDLLVSFAAVKERSFSLRATDATQVNVLLTAVHMPSYLLSAGDVVAVREKSKSTDEYKAIAEANAGRPVPMWMEKNEGAMEVKILRAPEREEIATPVEEHLIVEFYSK